MTEAKLAQQLAYLEQEALYMVFIDLWKAYDAMDCGRCLEILEEYGVGPNMLRLISYFWDNAELVCRASGYYGVPFKAHRGVTQGGPFSPRIFNVMVDAIVREWLRQMLGAEAAAEGYGDFVKVFLALFYADDAIIAHRDPAWLQESLNVLIELFERVGLRTNTSKTKAMICVPGKIRTCLTTSVYNRTRGCLENAEDGSYRVECDKCGQSLKEGSLASHLETQHGVYRSRVINQEFLVDRPAVVYEAHASAEARTKYFCPVPECEGWASTKWNLRRHFQMRHPKDLVDIPGEGVYPPCLTCGMQTSPLASGHERTAMCKEGGLRILQRKAAVDSALALQQRFTAYDEELANVEVFQYLGRLLAHDDNNSQSVRSNLKKARGCWARISRVLRAENASSRVCAMFYKATVQAVLLFGSETWNLTPTAMKRLEGFHIWAAYRMARVNKPRRSPTNKWTYPSLEDVLDEVGMHTIAEYIAVRRQTIMAFIVNWPIFSFCVAGERRRGTSPRQFWWEQSMNLDVARAAADSELGFEQDPVELT